MNDAEVASTFEEGQQALLINDICFYPGVGTGMHIWLSYLHAGVDEGGQDQEEL